MDSLFEGMVLFNPSSQQPPQVTASPNENEAPTNSCNSNNNNNTDNVEQVVYNRSDSIISEESLVSKPLDENLFSDLTLITPPSLVLEHSKTLELHPSPNTTTTTTTSTIKPIVRQVSSSGRKKKKRAAGLRIGYKKDEFDSDPQGPQQLVREDVVVVPTNEIETETRLSQLEAVVDNRVEVDGVIREGGGSVGLVEGKAVEVVGVESGGSIELEFEKVRITVFENLKSVRELVSSVLETRKESVRRRRSAAESLCLASTRYRELERELEEACEAEDFENADELSESLACADSEKEALAVALRDADAECDAIDSKMQQVIDIQIAAEEECATLLKGFATDAANSAELVLKNAEVVSSNETNNWLSSVEATEIKRMELDIESHLFNEARLVINDSVEHVVKDDKRERELLFKKKAELTGELEKLLALVNLKEAELAENEFSIEKVEKRIADATSSFQEVQSSINTRYNNLQSGLLQMEEQNEALFTKKKEIDDFLSQEEGRAQKIQELVKTSTDEANMYHEVAGLRKSLVQFILRSRERKAMLAKTGDKLTEDVQMLKQEISNARASLQELSSTKTSIQQEIESFKQRLMFIGKRVPELEAEKKVAASVRNFKEAARIAAEAKALSVEKEGIESKLDSALSEFGKLEEEISGTVNRLQDIEVQLLSKEKELAMTRFQILLLIAGAALSERSAALELGDVEDADILLGEAEVAEIEARKLQSTYNFKDEEFENLPKHFISLELVSNFGGEKLFELVASTQISSP